MASVSPTSSKKRNGQGLQMEGQLLLERDGGATMCKAGGHA